MPETDSLADKQYLLEKLKNYLAVCNMVVASNKERFPFAQIWRAMENHLEGRAIKFVISGHEKQVSQWVMLSKGRIKYFDSPPLCVYRSKTLVKKVPLPYLQTVLENPQHYMANPALIDWDWVFCVSAEGVQH